MAKALFLGLAFIGYIASAAVAQCPGEDGWLQPRSLNIAVSIYEDLRAQVRWSDEKFAFAGPEYDVAGLTQPFFAITTDPSHAHYNSQNIIGYRYLDNPTVSYDDIVSVIDEFEAKFAQLVNDDIQSPRLDACQVSLKSASIDKDLAQKQAVPDGVFKIDVVISIRFDESTHATFDMFESNPALDDSGGPDHVDFKYCTAANRILETSNCEDNSNPQLNLYGGDTLCDSKLKTMTSGNALLRNAEIASYHFTGFSGGFLENPCRRLAPSFSPTKNPTMSPTKSPSESPTKSPSESPSASPTKSPSKSPTESPSKSPSTSPTKNPTESPTKSPSTSPSKSPTASPSESPTMSPTGMPTASPSTSPTKDWEKWTIEYEVTTRRPNGKEQVHNALKDFIIEDLEIEEYTTYKGEPENLLVVKSLTYSQVITFEIGMKYFTSLFAEDKRAELLKELVAITGAPSSVVSFGEPRDIQRRRLLQFNGMTMRLPVTMNTTDLSHDLQKSIWAAIYDLNFADKLSKAVYFVGANEPNNLELDVQDKAILMKSMLQAINSGPHARERKELIKISFGFRNTTEAIGGRLGIDPAHVEDIKIQQIKFYTRAPTPGPTLSPTTSPTVHNFCTLHTEGFVEMPDGIRPSYFGCTWAQLCPNSDSCGEGLASENDWCKPTDMFYNAPKSPNCTIPGIDIRKGYDNKYKCYTCFGNRDPVVISAQPTRSPTMSPTAPTHSPTLSPSASPSASPTKEPTSSPTKTPTSSPTKEPTSSPTASPTKNPTKNPTSSPTDDPTSSPTKNPTASPTTGSPSSSPTGSPTKVPTKSPTDSPTSNPSVSPTPWSKICESVPELADGYADERPCEAVLQCPYSGDNNLDGTQHGFSRNMLTAYGDLLSTKCVCTLSVDDRTVIDIDCNTQAPEDLEISVAGLKDVNLKIFNSRSLERIELDMTNASIDILQITGNTNLRTLDAKLNDLVINERLQVARNPKLENSFPKTQGLSLPDRTSFGSNTGSVLLGCQANQEKDGIECTSCSEGSGLTLDSTKAQCV